MDKFLLAADIGATKTNIGLFQPSSGGLKQIAVRNFMSCGENELIHRVKEFLSAKLLQGELVAACFGVAGPVVDGQIEATNLGLKLDQRDLQKELNCSNLWLVNDLFATAAAISMLDSSEVAVLQSGDGGASDLAVPAAILAPGTGLGMAFLVDNKKLTILSSEGGHVDFAPRDDNEVKLWGFLKQRFGRVSRERLLSGPGMVNIFDWLKTQKVDETSVVVSPSRPPLSTQSSKLSGADVVAAADAGDILAREAVTLFTSLLGSVAGDLALMGMASGGIYLAGGIPAKIIDYLRQGQFLAAFNRKGRMSSWLEQVPVKIILNSEAALFGAARIARDRCGMIDK